MADPVSIVMGVTQTLLSIIQPLIQRVLEVRSHQQVVQELDRQIRDMERTLCTMAGVLKGVDDQARMPGVQVWLQQLKEVLFDADDLIDDYLTYASIQEIMALDQGEKGSSVKLMGASAKNRWRMKVHSLFSCFFTDIHDVNRSSSAIKLSEMANNVMIINERLHRLGKIRIGLGIKLTSESNITNATVNFQLRHTTSLLDIETPTEGRENVKKEIVNTLLARLDRQTASAYEPNTSNHRSIPIIPIVGMGGIGKTTLARLVFNDLKVKSKFDLLAWVCVSYNFDVLSLTKKSIESICFFQGKDKGCEWTTLEILQNELQKLVEGKNFLLILDDVWNVDDDLWELFLKPLNAIRTGNSCVITTTRDIGIANKVNTCAKPTYLEALGDEDVWKILHRNAFQVDKVVPQNYEKLEYIGKKIIYKLKGSPLAAKSIGRLLGSSHDVDHWLMILRSELWELEQDGCSILPILMLSYHHLPSNLKQCLLYFSLFPKNYQFSGDDMIHLWMGQNIIQSVRGERVEDIGKKYLKALVDRSFIQFDLAKYSMHDLIHDVLLSISQLDFYCVNQERKTENFQKNHTVSLRHVSIFNEGSTHLIQKICDDNIQYTKLRTLMFINVAGFDFNVVMEYLFEKMRFLRVLAMPGCSILYILESIEKLKHLRVLDLSFNYIKKLPESLGYLYNLQVLQLDGCDYLCQLPRSVTKLVSLRYLILDTKKISPIKQIGRLSMLQRLDLFSVGEENGMHINELKDMNLLHEGLEIKNIQFVKSLEEAQQAQLDKKEFLEMLKYGWATTTSQMEGREEYAIQMGCAEEEVFEALQPGSNLKRIRIEGYKGVRLPTWLNNSCLNWMENVELLNCNGIDALPPCLGKMQFLKQLTLYDMRNLKRIRFERTGNEKKQPSSFAERNGALFPALEMLILHNLPNLVECLIEKRLQEEEETIVKSVISLPHLERLSIIRCPKLDLVAVPALVSLKSLKLINTHYGAWRTLTLDGDFRAFTSLEKLVLGPCSSYCYVNNAANKGGRESWEKGGVRLVGRLPPPLSELKMENCDHMALSGYSCSELTTLRRLLISECLDIQFLHLPVAITYMERIYIAGCPNLTCFHLPSSLAALGSLTICDCHQMVSLQLSSATLVAVFRIEDCPKLVISGSPDCSCESTHMSSTKLPNPVIQEAMITTRREACKVRPVLHIKHLIISDAKREQLARLLWQIIPDRLSYLDISRCSDLENIDDDSDGFASAFLSFTSLKGLRIRECEHLRSLPVDMISRLLSLDSIYLNDCTLLSSLPNKESLESLQHLDFVGCSRLEGMHRRQG